MAQLGIQDFVGVFTRNPDGVGRVAGYFGRCVPIPADAWAGTNGVQTETRDFRSVHRSRGDRSTQAEMTFVLPVMDVDVSFIFEVQAHGVGKEASAWAQSTAIVVPGLTTRPGDELPAPTNPTGSLP